MHWESYAFIGTLIAGWSLVIIATTRWILQSSFDNLDKRFKSMEEKIFQNGCSQQEIERDLLNLKADLPLNYVRREDDIRQEAVINAKLDALAAKIDNLQMRVKGES